MAKKRKEQREMQEALKKLAEGVLRTNKLLEEQAAKTEKIRTEKKQIDNKKKFFAGKGVSAQMGNWATGKMLLAAQRATTEAISKGLQLQQTSLGRGLSLSKIVERGAATTDQLTNGITGYSKALEIVNEKFQAGYRRNVAATNKLAVYTKITGGNSLKLLKQMKKLTLGMNLSVDQEASLGNSIMAMSQMFHMTTEELQVAIGGLQKSMDNYKILNIGSEVAEAGVRLAGVLGQAAGTMGSEAIENLLSAQGALLAGQLGIQDLRLSIIRKEGDVIGNTMKLVMKGGAAAAAHMDRITKGSADPQQALDAWQKTVGPGFAKLAVTYKALQDQATRTGKSIPALLEAARAQNKISNDFNNSWANFKDQIVGPLQRNIMKAMSYLFDLAIQYKPALIKIGQAFLLLASLMGINRLSKGIGGKGKTGIIGKLLKPLKTFGLWLLKGMGQILWFIIKKAFHLLGKALYGAFIKVLPFLWRGLVVAISAIPGFGQIALLLGTIIYIFRDEIGGFLARMVATLDPIFDAVGPITAVIWDSIKWVGAVVWDSIMWVGDSIVGAFKWLWNNTVTFFKWLWSPIQWVLDRIGEAIAYVASWFGDETEDEQRPGAAPFATAEGPIMPVPTKRIVTAAATAAGFTISPEEVAERRQEAKDLVRLSQESIELQRNAADIDNRKLQVSEQTEANTRVEPERPAAARNQPR